MLSHETGKILSQWHRWGKLRLKDQKVAPVRTLVAFETGLSHYLNMHVARSLEEGKNVLQARERAGARSKLVPQLPALEPWLADYKSRQAPRFSACSAGVPSRVWRSTGALSSPIVWLAGAGREALGRAHWSDGASIATGAHPREGPAPLPSLGRLAPRPRPRTGGAARRILQAAAAAAGAAPAAGRKMMKFRFRRQGADPQREKLKQELFAFNKVRRRRRPGLGGRGRQGAGRGLGLGAREPEPRRARGEGAPGWGAARGPGVPSAGPTSRLRPCPARWVGLGLSLTFRVCVSGSLGLGGPVSASLSVSSDSACLWVSAPDCDRLPVLSVCPCVHLCPCVSSLFPFTSRPLHFCLSIFEALPVSSCLPLSASICPWGLSNSHSVSLSVSLALFLWGLFRSPVSPWGSQVQGLFCFRTRAGQEG